MSRNDSGYVELAYQSIPVFANDGTIDMQELNFLMGIALRDDEIDDDERRVLANIFDRVKKSDVAEKVWSRIQEIRKKHSI